MPQCLVCKAELTKLGRHVKLKHGLDFIDYVIQYKHGGKRPLCACGTCGEETSYQSSISDFAKFIRGHQAKIASDETRQKQSEARRQYFIDNPDARKRVSDDLARWRGENPGAASEVVRKAHRDHPNSFKKSDETREKMSASHLEFWAGPDGDDARAEASRIRKELWKKPEYGQRILATKRSRMDGYRKNGGYGSAEWSGRISTKITELIEAGDYWARGRYLSSKVGEVPYRSSWELLRMAELDADPDVVSWEYEPFHLIYKFDGRDRRYIPDFKIILADGSVMMEEVGPRSVKMTPRNTAKRSALTALCTEKGWRMRWPSA